MKSVNLLWALAGGLLLAGLVALVFHYQNENVSSQLARKAERSQLLARMRVSLGDATEAEKSAVMAITDVESRAFADRARGAENDVAKQSASLRSLLANAHEKELLAQFDKSFAELERIDKELLDLAVRNSNLKASALAFGPAAKSIDTMDQSLSQLIAHSNSPKLIARAAAAQAGALRILALLPPHIAEESDARMDQLEERMKEEDQKVREALKEVNLADASQAYEQFSTLRKQILELSRQNTNVRSLSISLHEKRRLTAVCEEALSTLETAIENEPIAGASRPR
jgi:hypothetical protein